MPSRAEIVSFDDSPPPPGADPRVSDTAPDTGIEITGPDPAWPRQYDDLASRIRQVLGWRVLHLEHVGSTSIPGLAAKPIIDIDLTVADPDPREMVPAEQVAAEREVIAECCRRILGGEPLPSVVRDLDRRTAVGDPGRPFPWPSGR